jgi:NAD(P)-dependent dehydrogenase (short-subunit alcohol dehydrogenase family)
MDELFNVNDKIVIVTGSGRGNGEAIADGFLKRGAIVYGLDIDFETNLEHKNYNKLTFDISLLDKIPELVQDIYSKHGNIDVLINNAGIGLSSSDPYSDDIFDKTFKTNLRAPYIFGHEVALLMSHHSGGSIINITSLGAEIGFPENPSYQVAKAALKQYTKALAMDFGRYGVRVNNVCPGYIRTSMTEKSYNDKALRDKRSKRMILGRWGTPKDLVGPCLFLASNASAYITGSSIYVDGGWTAKGL